MNSGASVNFDASHHAVVNLLGLGAILVLPHARVPLLKLYCQRATSVLPSCVCYLANLGPHLYSKGSCVSKNRNFGTASCQLPLSELNRDSAVHTSKAAK